jgi:flagellar protein FlaG
MASMAVTRWITPRSWNMATATRVFPLPTSPESTSSAPDARLAIAAAAPQAPQEAKPSRQQLDDAVKAVNDFVNPVNNSLQFRVDDDTGKTIVKVIDKTTNEVIRQFPSEEMIAIAKALDGIKGLLFRQKA